MQINRFNFSPGIGGLVCVYEPALSAYYAGIDDLFVFTKKENEQSFKQCPRGMVILFTIGNHPSDVQLDIRQDETVPPADNVVHAMQMPFLIKGDSGIRIEIPSEESQIIDIPSGKYLLTVHQAFTGKYPFGHPKNASEEDKKWWPEKPVWMRMWFNRVDSLDEQVAEGHWNRPDDE